MVRLHRLPRPKPGTAAYYREMREAFEVALAVGCTPADALRDLRRRKVEEADRAAPYGQVAKIDDSSAPSVTADDWEAPWMMRD